MFWAAPEVARTQAWGCIVKNYKRKKGDNSFFAVDESDDGSAQDTDINSWSHILLGLGIINGKRLKWYRRHLAVILKVKKVVLL